MYSFTQHAVQSRLLCYISTKKVVGLSPWWVEVIFLENATSMFQAWKRCPLLTHVQNGLPLNTVTLCITLVWRTLLCNRNSVWKGIFIFVFFSYTGSGVFHLLNGVFSYIKVLLNVIQQNSSMCSEVFLLNKEFNLSMVGHTPSTFVLSGVGTSDKFPT